MAKSVTVEDVEYFEVEREAQVGDMVTFENGGTVYLVTKLPTKTDDDCITIKVSRDADLIGKQAYANTLINTTVFAKPKRIPKTGELIQVVAAEPTEDRPYINGDVFEVGYAWGYEDPIGRGGVTTVQNVELYDREFVLLDELSAPNPHAEVFGTPMGAEFGSDEYEFLKHYGATRVGVWGEDVPASVGYLEQLGPAIILSEEPTVEFIGDKVDHPSHYKQGKFETIEIIEEITQGYDDGYVSYCVGNTIKYLARAPHKHDTPEEDLRKAAKYIEFALKRLSQAE